VDKQRDATMDTSITTAATAARIIIDTQWAAKTTTICRRTAPA